MGVRRQMDGLHKWVALGYSVPINPSRNRVYVWRKLKEFGAEYFKQGVAVLPHNKKNALRFDRLALKIVEMGGDAQLVELRFLRPADDAALTAKFKKQSDSEYSELLRECGELFSSLRQHAGERLEDYQTEQLRRMVRRYSLAKSRDHFQSGLSEELEEKLYTMLDSFCQSGAEVRRQLLGILGRK